MSLSSRMLRAAERARAAFETYVDTFGSLATWKRRSDAIGATSGSMSAAAGIADPVDEDWVARLSDPRLYSDHASLRVTMNVPGDLQAENVGQMITGTSSGYIKREHEVCAGDVLLIDGVHWYVDGARLVSPPIYRELTLRRE